MSTVIDLRPKANAMEAGARFEAAHTEDAAKQGPALPIPSELVASKGDFWLLLLRQSGRSNPQPRQSPWQVSCLALRHTGQEA